MLKPKIGVAIAASESESERILTMVIDFDRIGSGRAVNGAHAPIRG
jgi:hypothetical protein